MRYSKIVEYQTRLRLSSWKASFSDLQSTTHWIPQRTRWAYSHQKQALRLRKSVARVNDIPTHSPGQRYDQFAQATRFAWLHCVNGWLETDFTIKRWPLDSSKPQPLISKLYYYYRHTASCIPKNPIVFHIPRTTSIIMSCVNLSMMS